MSVAEFGISAGMLAISATYSHLGRLFTDSGLG